MSSSDHDRRFDHAYEAAAAGGAHPHHPQRQHALLGPGGLAAMAQSEELRALQMKAGPGAATDADGMHHIAARGVAGSGRELPHGERIQAAFGRHDVSDVQAHVGGPAEEAAMLMNAQAYATGREVAFARQPDLHTAAHEAAHVVQQRGGVSLKGGVGQAGDAHERHADAVADAVVAGRSAEALLDGYAGGGAEGPAAIQRKEDPDKAQGDGGQSSPAAEKAAPSPEPEPLSAKQVSQAMQANDATQLRIDWVRNLQARLRPDGKPATDDGSFDEQTVRAVADFQREQALKAPPGVIDAATRTALEKAFPELKATLVGPHLQPRVLVPASAGEAERFEYYRQIITDAGGAFDEARVNLLGMRGVEVERSKGGVELRQTSSAGAFAQARATGEGKPQHFSGKTGVGDKGEGRYDDVIVALWAERDADGKVTGYHVQERIGSVDPASVNKDQGTAHVRDGQYLYALGDHGTAKGGAHADAVENAYAKSKTIRVYERGGRVRYTALTLARDVEVWRDGYDPKQRSRSGGAGNDHFPTPAEEAASDTRIAANDPDYQGRSSIMTNIHSSPDAAPSSLGCQVIPVGEDYEGLIAKVAEKNKAEARGRRGSVLYTLIDASKVTPTLVKTEAVEQ